MSNHVSFGSFISAHLSWIHFPPNNLTGLNVDLFILSLFLFPDKSLLLFATVEFWYLEHNHLIYAGVWCTLYGPEFEDFWIFGYDVTYATMLEAESCIEFILFFIL